MEKRLLNCEASDFMNMSAEDLKSAIYASEGRTILTEAAAPLQPVVDGITNAEIAKFAGADLILLNAFDVIEPVINGIDEEEEYPVKKLKELVGRPVGVNLEPINDSIDLMDQRESINKGRYALEENYIRAQELGFDFICLTGNPGTGVANSEIIKAIKVAKKKFNGLIIAGKMHSSGVDEPVIDKNTVEQFIEAGADVLLLPAVYTVPGFDTEDLKNMVKIVQKHNKSQTDPSRKVLTMTAIGTSQESSDKAVIQKIALECKACGVDIQHIGDGGFSGLTLYQNINTLGNAIRGERHQLRIRARSIKR